MSQRRYKVKKNKRIFGARKQGNSYIGIIIMVILLAALVFIGYSVGKPIVEYFSGKSPSEDEPDTPPAVTDAPDVTSPVTENTPPQTSEQTEPQEISDNPQAQRSDIMYINYADCAGGSYEEYILNMLNSAAGYSGVCVELVADGGTVAYQTASELATGAGAVAANAIPNLEALASAITEAGMTPYARVSSLTDNIVAWYDKSVCYMIQGSTSRWLDDAADNGGKPWISPFSDRAKEYIGGLCSEISDAGFAGMVAAGLEFPQFRSSDLNYIGNSVKAADRYTALVSFAQYMHESFGTDKEFIIEVGAKDIIAGDAEILTDTSALVQMGVNRLLVRFDPDEIGTRISKDDGTPDISFEGLNDVYLLKTVAMHIDESLGDSGLNITFLIKGCELDAQMYDMIDEIGYEDAQVAINEAVTVDATPANAAAEPAGAVTTAAN